MVPDKELDEAIQAFASNDLPGTRNVHALLVELRERRDAPEISELLSKIRPTAHDLKLSDQWGKVHEEIFEIHEELCGGDMQKAAVETWDGIQASVTLLKQLEKNGAHIGAAHSEMNEKNQRRGYYEGAAGNK